MAQRKPAVRALDSGSRRDRAIGMRRLDRLDAFLETMVPQAAFDFNQLVRIPYGAKPPLEALEAGGGCGTVCCAMGWTPAVFPGLVEWMPTLAETASVILRGRGQGTAYYITTARLLFALSDDEADILFSPRHSWQDPRDGCQAYPGVRRLDSHAGPKDVAANIRAFTKAVRESESIGGKA